MYGSGPDWSYVSGPYLVGAEARSVTQASLAAAEWVRPTSPSDQASPLTADNGLLLDAIGHLDMVTAIGGLVNAGSAFFDRRISPYQIALIRKVRHPFRSSSTSGLATVHRCMGPTSSRASPTRRLTLAELNKWNACPALAESTTTARSGSTTWRRSSASPRHRHPVRSTDRTERGRTGSCCSRLSSRQERGSSRLRRLRGSDPYRREQTALFWTLVAWSPASLCVHSFPASLSSEAGGPRRPRRPVRHRLRPPQNLDKSPIPQQGTSARPCGAQCQGAGLLANGQLHWRAPAWHHGRRRAGPWSAAEKAMERRPPKCPCSTTARVRAVVLGGEPRRPAGSRRFHRSKSPVAGGVVVSLAQWPRTTAAQSFVLPHHFPFSLRRCSCIQEDKKLRQVDG